RLLRWVEGRTRGFDTPDDAVPPTAVGRFYVQYLRQVRWVFVAMSLVGFCVALIAVALFAFIGRIIDLVKAMPMDTFFAAYGWQLIGMAAVVIIARPLFSWLQNLLINQAVIPHLTNRIRWQHHRYVIRQSLQFFRDDYAGRVSNRIMQTGMALRESTLQATRAIWYVLVYIGSSIALFTHADWRLVIPLALWLATYVALLVYCVPR